MYIVRCNVGFDEREGVVALAERICRLCGGFFEGANNALYCDDCKTAKCPACGKEIKMSPAQMKMFVKRGWVCCSRKCGQAWRNSAHGLLKSD